MTASRAERPGFTLIELLVVTAIMATLFGLVLSGSKPGTTGQIRQAAQSLASSLTAAQSRALGNPAGAAVILESGTASGLSDNVSVRVLNADVPPFITGTTTATGANGSLIEPGSMSGVLTLVPTTADAADLQHGYRIRFGGAVASGGASPYQPPSEWFSLAASSPPSATVAFRVSAGQTHFNTSWPVATTAAGGGYNPIDFQVARYPVPTDVAVQLPKSVAIDLRYSGPEDDPSVDFWGRLASAGAIGVVFTSVGGVDSIMQAVTDPPSVRQAIAPLNPTKPLYLLLSPRDDVESNAPRPLGNPASMWIAIHPQTGRVTVAPNVPQSGSGATDVRAAREKARALVVDRK